MSFHLWLLTCVYGFILIKSSLLFLSLVKGAISVFYSSTILYQPDTYSTKAATYTAKGMLVHSKAWVTENLELWQAVPIHPKNRGRDFGQDGAQLLAKYNRHDAQSRREGKMERQCGTSDQPDLPTEQNTPPRFK